MSIEDFKGLMDSFDPAALFPDLDAIIVKIAPLARAAVLIGPVVLLVMGLMYLFIAPKEANYYFGYRCYYGMGSEEAWRYTQRIAGIGFAALGLVLGIVMLIVSGSFGEMETMDLLWKAVACVVWEAGLAAAACIAVNTMAAIHFDGKGDRRKKRK